uniref:Glycoside hydrolase family 92 protein n=1 Tax=Mycena chlorophos TaxID=658473 RepID=A0ABQ0LGT8_MYCCL|nr:glycoside hydrolase family 92 protein [Mycena chlorophos]
MTSGNAASDRSDTQAASSRLLVLPAPNLGRSLQLALDLHRAAFFKESKAMSSSAEPRLARDAPTRGLASRFAPSQESKDPGRSWVAVDVSVGEAEEKLRTVFEDGAIAGASAGPGAATTTTSTRSTALSAHESRQRIRQTGAHVDDIPLLDGRQWCCRQRWVLSRLDGQEDPNGQISCRFSGKLPVRDRSRRHAAHGRPDSETTWVGTGGGFSSYFEMPSYHASAVSSFLTNHPPPYTDGLYNNSGKARGFADMSMNGGRPARLLAIPATRHRRPPPQHSSPWSTTRVWVKAPVGFVNPVLYGKKMQEGGVWRDITTGNNLNCGTDGFEACVVFLLLWLIGRCDGILFTIASPVGYLVPPRCPLFLPSTTTAPAFPSLPALVPCTMAYAQNFRKRREETFLCKCAVEPEPHEVPVSQKATHRANAAALSTALLAPHTAASAAPNQETDQESVRRAELVALDEMEEGFNEIRQEMGRPRKQVQAEAVLLRLEQNLVIALTKLAHAATDTSLSTEQKHDILNCTQATLMNATNTLGLPAARFKGFETLLGTVEGKIVELTESEKLFSLNLPMDPRPIHYDSCACIIVVRDELDIPSAHIYEKPLQNVSPISQMILLFGLVCKVTYGMANRASEFIVRTSSLLVRATAEFMAQDDPNKADLPLESSASLKPHQQALLDSLPNGILHILEQLDQDSKTTKYAVCPTCHHLYLPIFASSTRNSKWPSTCTNEIVGKLGRFSCDTKLLNADGQPSKTYLVPSFVDYVARLLSDPELENFADSACDKALVFKTSGNAGSPTYLNGNIFHAEFLQALDGKLFIDRGNDVHLAFGLSFDFFPPYGSRRRSAQQSIGALSIYCLNLPLDFRYKQPNVYLSITTGPHDPPGTYIMPYVNPVVDNLEQGFKRGFHLSRTANSSQNGRTVKTALAFACCDLQGARKLSGAAGPTAEIMCTCCTVRRSEGLRTDFENWKARDHNTMRLSARKWSLASTTKEQDTIFAADGVHDSSLYRYSGWNAPRMLVVDSMHNTFEGLAQYHCRYVLEINLDVVEKSVKAAPAFSFDFPGYIPELYPDGFKVPQGHIKDITSIHIALSLSLRKEDEDEDEDDPRRTVAELTIYLSKRYKKALVFVAHSLDLSGLKGKRKKDLSPDELLQKQTRAELAQILVQWRLTKPLSVPFRPKTLTLADFRFIQSVIRDTVRPASVGFVPTRFGEKGAGTITADQWRLLATIFVPIALVILWGEVPGADSSYFQGMLDHTMALFQAIMVISRYKTSPDRAARYRVLLRQWVDGLIKWHPHTQYHRRPNIHMAFHIHDFARLFGSVYNWWMFPIERINGTLQNINTNHHLGGEHEATLLNTWLRMGNLQRWMRRPDCPAILKRFYRLCQSFLRMNLGDVEDESPGETAEMPTKEPAYYKYNGLQLAKASTHLGATVPHGMVKVGMDTDGDNFAGYDPNPLANVTGFSQLHQSGIGGAVPLSNFKLFPIPECPVNNNHFEQYLTFIAGRKTLYKLLPSGLPDDFASMGYFSTNLTYAPNSPQHAAPLYTATPSPPTPPSHVSFLDITNDGQVSGVLPELSIDPTTGRMLASGNYATSFGIARYNAYACVDFRGDGYDFSGPSEWVRVLPTARSPTDERTNREYGGLMSFPANPNGGPTSILARLGVSFISTAQACQNAEEEIPDFDFAGVVSDAEDQWRDILNRVQVNSTGADDDTVTLLYSSLYRTQIVPGDYTGERPKWNSTEPYYDAFYCNWDTYWTLFPSYMSLHDPEKFARIVRGMINIQQHEGWLPEAREAGQQQFIQGGSHGDQILAEFYIKFSQHAAALNVSDLYNALLADAENTPPNWNLQGRQADVRKEKGYIPSDTTSAGGANIKQVSRALEYAFDDFAISEVAKMMGKMADAKKVGPPLSHLVLLHQLTVYHTSTGSGLSPNNSVVTGFFQPRFANGTWNFTDPRHCSVHDPTQSTCFLNAIRRDGFNESSPIVVHPLDRRDGLREGAVLACVLGRVLSTTQSVSVNGKPYKSNCYLDWDVFTSGSLVEIEVTNDIRGHLRKGKGRATALAVDGRLRLNHWRSTIRIAALFVSSHSRKQLLSSGALEKHIAHSLVPHSAHNERVQTKMIPVAPHPPGGDGVRSRVPEEGEEVFDSEAGQARMGVGNEDDSAAYAAARSSAVSGPANRALRDPSYTVAA